MKLRLTHGRDDPEVDMEEQGYDGPSLPGIVFVRQLYLGITLVHFTSVTARKSAQQHTGWQVWDDESLEVRHHGDLIETREVDGRTRFYSDLSLEEEQDVRRELDQAKITIRNARRDLHHAIAALPDLPT